jgi:hypothetical protein
LGRQEDVSTDPFQKPKTIYGELKLSDKLITKLEGVKEELVEKNNQLEEKVMEAGKWYKQYVASEKEKRIFMLKLSLAAKEINFLNIYKNNAEIERVGNHK